MSSPRSRCDVAVIGAGPAGVAVAVGLARLGHSVCMISGPARRGVEGGSPRLLKSLHAAGLAESHDSIRLGGERLRDWAGSRESSGIEYLIDRAAFDAALRRDALSAGVRCEWAHADECLPMPDGWCIAAGGSTLRARALVDARGRRLRAAAVRGPRLLAVTQRYRVRQSRPATGIAMAVEGWYWFADDGAGHLELQAVCAPGGAGSRSALLSRLWDLKALPAMIAERLSGAVADGPPRACAAGAWWREPAAAPGRVLAGDAAMAVDPLSGHGIYEALAGAPANIAAVNTWLEGGDWDLVRTFMRERAGEIWRRKLLAARDFYAAGAGDESGFWGRTKQGYAALADTGTMVDHAAPSIRRRPVLNGSRIEWRRVWVGRRWPRGVWQVAGVDIAALLDCGGPEGLCAEEAARRLQQSPDRVRQALSWLQNEMAPPTGGAPGFQRIETVDARMARSST